MVEIDLCLLKAFPWSTSVLQNNSYRCLYQYLTNVMMCLNYVSDDIKHDPDTTAADIKHVIELLKQLNVIYPVSSNICENTDGCAEHYICAIEL